MITSDQKLWLSCTPPAPLVISGDLPDGSIGQTVSFQYTTTGGVQPYGNYVLETGALPNGLSMDSNGLVTGTYMGGGNFTWSVRRADSTNTMASLIDNAIVGEEVWFLSAGVPAGAVGVTGNYSTDSWTTTTAPGLNGYTCYTNDRIFISMISGRGLRYSADRGSTWITDNPPNTPSGGGGWLSFGAGYVFVSGGVNLLQRYHIDTGVWSSASNTVSRSNSAVYHNGKVVSVSIYNYAASISNDNGATFTYGSGTYASGQSGNPRIASDGTLLAVFYNDGHPEYNAKIAYSEDDGQTWTQAYTFGGTTGAAIGAADIHYHDGKWVAALTDGRIAMSNDGKAWTASTATLGGTIQQFASALGKIITVRPTGVVMSTIDGGASFQTATGIPTLSSGAGITRMFE